MPQRKTTTTTNTTGGGVEQRACPPGKYSRRRRRDDACERVNCCLWPPDLNERGVNVPEISLSENPLDLYPRVGGEPYKMFSDKTYMDESITVENTNSEEFLKDLIVEVHVIDDPSATHVDLAGHRKPNTPRNFTFQKMPWREMIRRIRKGEKLYTRHTNGPKKAANVLTDFQDPETKRNPFDTPTFHGRCRETRRMVERFYAAARNNSDVNSNGTVVTHSSVLRVSSPGTTLWMHFDTRDNILHQLSGRKRVILYAPECEPWLNVEGSSARLKYMRGYENFDEKIINEISCDEELEYNYRLFDAIRLERAHVCTLEPGDALYIPALWFHRVTSLPSETNEPSVAVNVFYNRVDIDYDGKDVYGNKDPVKGKDAMQKASELGAMLNTLPPPYKTFYARRCLNEIAAQLDMYLRIPDHMPNSHPPLDNTFCDENKEALKAFED